LTNVGITRFRQCRDLVRESEIAGRVSGIKRSVYITPKSPKSGSKSGFFIFE